MKAARLTKFNLPDSVTIVDIEQPIIGDNSVLVKVYAAGVNPIDYKIRNGHLQPALPITLGGDFSGIVIDVGKNALAFKPGDEVYGGASIFRNGSGSFAQYCIADVSTVAYKSKGMDHVEASAYPLAGISALQGLTEHIRLSKGHKILIHGGAGGIGHLAIQIAKHIGAYVATTVNAKDINFVKNLGADLVIDYKQDRFEEKIENFDYVFDTVAGDSYRRSFKVLHKGGVLVSMLERPDEELMKQYDIRALTEWTQITTDKLDELTRLIDLGAVKVYLGKKFTLDQTSEALSYLQTAHPRGKITIDMGE